MCGSNSLNLGIGAKFNPLNLVFISDFHVRVDSPFEEILSAVQVCYLIWLFSAFIMDINHSSLELNIILQ